MLNKTRSSTKNRNHKKKILELKITMTELNNSKERFKNRLHHAEEGISDLEDRTFEMIQSGEQIEKRVKKEYVTYRTQLKETIVASWQFQKKRKRQRIFKAIMAKNSPT